MPVGTNGVSQPRVTAWVAWQQPQQRRGRNERNPSLGLPIKPPDDRDPAAIHHDEPMVSRMDARLTGYRERQNLAGCDVANIIGLRKLRQRQRAVGQRDEAFLAGTAERRSRTQKK